MNRVLIILFLCASHSYGSARQKELESIGKRLGVYKEYEEPFLVTQTVKLTKLNADQALQLIVDTLKKNTISLETLAVPKEMKQGDQFEALQDCSLEKCNVKLSDADEKKQLQKSKEKIETYGALVKERLKKYLDNKVIRGYEAVPSIHPLVAKMIDLMPEFRKSVPKTASFLGSGLWVKESSRPDVIQSNFLRHEMMSMDAKKLQPTERVADAYVFSENDIKGVFEVHIYTNHYFDSSSRVFEVGQGVVSVTDIMDVDELKKSGFIRFLYKAKMQDAVLKFQEDELGRMGFK